MNEATRIYWQKVESGELWLQYCSSCERYIFYPRSICPFCLESSLEWKKACGKGRVYSYTIVNISALPEFNLETPYLYAVIELDEGVKMPSNVVQCSLDKISVGLPVELTLLERNHRKLPAFRPRDY